MLCFCSDCSKSNVKLQPKLKVSAFRVSKSAEPKTLVEQTLAPICRRRRRLKMEVVKATICRLCLKTCNTYFKMIEDDTQETLDLLLPNLDLSISHEPVVCDTCLDSLKKCFVFKAKCLHKIDSISFASKKDEEVEELKVYPDITLDIADTTSAFSHSVCYFCMEPINYDSFMHLKDEWGYVVERLEQCFPELVINITEDSTACEPCYRDLQHCFTFISNCFNIEEKIREYCKVEGTNNKNQVNLDSILQFTSKKVLLIQYSGCNYNTVKLEPCERVKDDNPEVEIKNEDYEKLEQQELDLKEESVQMKMEQDDRDDRLNTRPTGTDKKIPGIKRFKCEVCIYQSDRKSHVDAHMLTHKDDSQVMVYKCEICIYTTKYKYEVRRHMLTHKSASEVTMYKCSVCSFETKYRQVLPKHMITHKSNAEVTMYKCEICTFQTKHKNCLRKHMATHRSTLETTTYKCDICGFKTKYKNALEKHMLVHKNPSEITTYKCDICPCETKYKNVLRKHMLTHMSEVTMYECSKCTFKSKLKTSLSRHIQTHKSILEVMTYDCNVCNFKTRRKANLSRHLLIHKSTSEVSLFECNVCTFKTKLKGSLTRHMLIHKSTSEVPMYKCELCFYETKHKRYISGHMLTHKGKMQIANVCVTQGLNSATVNS